jgi:hypothetical protein
MDGCVEAAKVVQYVNKFFAWVRNGIVGNQINWWLEKGWHTLLGTLAA